MDCKECDGLLVAYVKGELAQEDAALVERHIRACEHCRWNEAAARQSLEVVEAAADDETPAAKLVASIIDQAIEARASDIHIERERDGAARVRYRVDGVLHEAHRLPADTHEPLTCRFLVLAELNAFERRVPQFGRIRSEHEGRAYDLRVATLPGTRGMALVIRLFDGSLGLSKLDELGLSDVNLGRLEQAIRQPTGILLVCGPAGAGKTTLLYAMLSRLARPEISVLTVEDPVEIEIPDATQIHLNRKMGLTYPTALEAFLRSDPDIIMCGDIPDGATASALLRLAVTGHLVLAPVACGDLAEGLAKLRDLVPDPLLIAHTLIGAVGVRLVRKVCPHCAQDVPPTELEQQTLLRMGLAEPPPTIRRGAGCEQCRKTGYFGRTGIHEVLLLDEALAERIAEASLDEVRGATKPRMVEDAAAKVVAGITTLEETVRVAGPLLGK